MFILITYAIEIDRYELELEKFMYQLYNNELPVAFTECFNKIKNLHEQKT